MDTDKDPTEAYFIGIESTNEYHKTDQSDTGPCTLTGNLK